MWTRLRERVRVQARVLEIAFVDRRLARVGYETWVRRRLERAAGRAETVEDLSRSDCNFLVSVKERVLVLGASTHLFVELDFAVKVLLGDPGKVLGLLGVVCLHLGYRRVQHSFAPRRDFLVWLAGGGSQWSVCGGSVGKADVPVTLLSPLCIATAHFDGYLQSAVKV